MLYPQNGDRIVAIDSVTSLQAMYSQTLTLTLAIADLGYNGRLL